MWHMWKMDSLGLLIRILRFFLQWQASYGVNTEAIYFWWSYMLTFYVHIGYLELGQNP